MTFMIMCAVLGIISVGGAAVLLNHRRKDKKLDYDHQMKMQKSLEESIKS
jgi:heme/copper-type cytochrome/quinol oxidase subunit 2